MKIIDKIVKGNLPPKSTGVLWYNPKDNTFYVYKNGWIAAAGGGEIPPEVLAKKADIDGSYPDLGAGRIVQKASDGVTYEAEGFLFRTSAGSYSISDGTASVLVIQGNVVNGVPFNATHYRTIGFNAANPANKITGYTLDDGAVTADANYSLVLVHVVQGQSGSGRNNGYVVSSTDENDVILVGNCATAFDASDITGSTVPEITMLTESINYNSKSYLPDAGYLVIACKNPSALQVHLAWSGYRDTDTEEYSSDALTLVHTHSWGTGKAGNAYDIVTYGEFSGIITKTKRVDRISINDENLDWEYIEPEQGVEPTEYVYKSSYLSDVIKPSTTAIECYGYNISCNAQGEILITSDTELDLDNLVESYIYYELDEPETTTQTGQTVVEISDFGTEEFIYADPSTAVLPSLVKIHYTSNLVDTLRSLASTDILSRIEILESKMATINGEVQTSDDYVDQHSYGIKWSSTLNNNTACIRIGSPIMHRLLPIQSKMRGCVHVQGTVQYWLDAANWAYKADGTASVLDGTDGDVGVYIPKFYIKSGIDGDYYWFRMSEEKIDNTWTEVPAAIIGAYDCVLDGSNHARTLVDATLRGGNKSPSYDSDSVKSTLGKPITNTQRSTMRGYANWWTEPGRFQLLDYYGYHKYLIWLYLVEYANFNVQLAVNNTLTAEGYHQGGLGLGVTTMVGWNTWTSFNGNNPITPCGTTNSLGNGSGEVALIGSTMSFMVSRYRGIENIFGDIWQNLDGVVSVHGSSSHTLYYVQANDSLTAAAFTALDTTPTNGTAVSESTQAGYVKEFNIGTKGDLVASEISGTDIDYSTKYKADYHYTNTSSGSCLFRVGGDATDGAPAGLARFDSNLVLSYSHTHVGFRLITHTIELPSES